ncbi:hypothetical protein ABZ357_39755 [Streptomyces sp. NPDC005917]|uniref:hypothetical protein n=1 Tax=unclassified Streptomyces TaxID=2593676 RepID=UPI0033F1DD32
MSRSNPAGNRPAARARAGRARAHRRRGPGTATGTPGERRIVLVLREQRTQDGARAGLPEKPGESAQTGA